jgi:hypothetical protein
VVLSTPDYNHKLAALLEVEAYRKLRRILLSPWNPRHFSWRNSHLLRWFAKNSDNIWGRPTIYGLPKIHKQGVPLRSTVNTPGAPRYRLSKRLAGLLSSHRELQDSREKPDTLRPHFGLSPGWCHSSPGCRPIWRLWVPKADVLRTFGVSWAILQCAVITLKGNCCKRVKGW